MNGVSWVCRAVFQDGSEVTQEVSFDQPILRIEMERELGKTAYSMIQSELEEPYVYGTWWLLHKAGSTPLGYEQWLEQLASFEILDVKMPKAAGKPDPKPRASKGAETESS